MHRWWLFMTLTCLAMVQGIEFNLYDDSTIATENPGDTTLAEEFISLNNALLLWGPYRSGLYFGVAPRIPRSLLSGLMWFSLDNFSGIRNLKHAYEQHDNMKKANWVNYDPRIGGRQVIDDADLHARIVIDFVKTPDGHSWAAKVRAIPHKGYENIKISFVWYLGLETGQNEVDLKSDGYLVLDGVQEPYGYPNSVTLTGLSEELGPFNLEITDGPKTNRHPKKSYQQADDLDPTKAHHMSLHVPNDNVWKAKDIFMTLLQESLELLKEQYLNIDSIPPEQVYIIRNIQNFQGNMHFVQKIYQGACEFDVIYTNSQTPVHDVLTKENLPSKIADHSEQIKSKFHSHFQLLKPFGDEKYDKFAREIFSGLTGGLIYQYGDLLVDRETIFDEDLFEKHNLHGSLEGPTELFSLVPSRPFFPRGFYWDEGFHLLPLLQYDSDLVLDILKYWFVLVDDKGWIAREQILGPELRSRVPEEFQTQSPEIVNPPTMMLALSYLLDKIQPDVEQPIEVKEFGTFAENDFKLGNINLQNPQLLVNYTKNLYPNFKKHYEMFRRTQKGYTEDFDRESWNEVYRWRGRTVDYCLASGMDDYPRAIPADIAEVNVDLVCWVGVMAKSMVLMAQLLGLDEDVAIYNGHIEQIMTTIEKVHWSEKDNAYCDVSVDEEDENIHVCHKGYVSLFPFFTKLIPEQDIDKIESVVDLIKDPEQLWTEYGIRSLSSASEMYETVDNYWTSPIWPHMNYLILNGLIHYSEVSGAHMNQELKEKISTVYSELRLNLVNNVYDQWKKTGYVWEIYDDKTGEAKGAKNFLGWGSTVLLVMQMPASI